MIQERDRSKRRLERGIPAPADRRGSKTMSKGTVAIAGAALALTLLATGCKVDVNKTGNGEDKDVSISTPFGGMQVHKGAAGALSMGLPLYPGATLTQGNDDDDKSVDLHMGFGKWQMHVQVANYTTPDPESKVQDFYAKALHAYGSVITCRNDEPVGQPTKTPEGLTCKEDGGGHANVQIGKDHDLELKSGSKHHQHIVALKNENGSGTHFALVEVSLPGGDEGGEE